MIRTMIRNVALVAAMGSALAASNAQAGFSGSLAIGGGNTTSNNNDLALATSFGIPNVVALGNGTGDLSYITFLTGFTGGTLNTTTGGFSFTGADGTFTETGGPTLVGTATSNEVGYYLVGTFGGGSITPGTPASLFISFTFNGASVSSSGTLSIPPAPVPGSVPEPASIAMLGLGLVAVGSYGLRRRMAK